MAFLDYLLEPPTYGWSDNKGNLIKPTASQIFSEFFSRLNIFKTPKNWLPFFSWMTVVCLFPFLMLFIFKFFTWWLFAAAFVYSMIIMGTHGTIWHHRFCTHGAYKFRNKFWRFFTQNLTIKAIPEEIYVLSHHVHHAKSDQPGDPYNAQGGFLYCFLADVNHQPMNRNLSKADYAKAVNLMKHTGIKPNTYAQYLHWGSVANPFVTVMQLVLNWAFWYAIFYLIGGHALSCAIFGSAFVWAVGVRTFNYEGHGKGEDKRTDGIDFNREDMSINQLWPGIVAGEWHNNHHMYPKSARTGFKAHQLDFAWYYIKTMHVLGAVTHYRDSKKDFLKDHHEPYINQKKNKNSRTPISTNV
jgi:stearoyl-CoA desaturase (delta-9 desaturase)